jgi:FtsZ family, C-terminal domain
MSQLTLTIFSLATHPSENVMNQTALATITLQPQASYARVIKVVGIGAVGATAIAQLSLKNNPYIECVTFSHESATADISYGRETHADEAYQLLVHDTDMLFIAAPANDATPIKLATMARTLGILTVAVLASDAASHQANFAADSFFTSEAEHLPAVLQQVVHGLVDSVHQAGLLNMDSDEIQHFLHNQGRAQVGVGVAVGATRAQQATAQALRREMSDASKVLITVTSSSALKLSELESVLNTVAQTLPNAMLLVSSVFDESMQDALRVTLISRARAGE